MQHMTLAVMWVCVDLEGNPGDLVLVFPDRTEQEYTAVFPHDEHNLIRLMNEHAIIGYGRLVEKTNSPSLWVVAWRKPSK